MDWDIVLGMFWVRFGHGSGMLCTCFDHMLAMFYACVGHACNMLGEYVDDALIMCLVYFEDVMFRIYFRGSAGRAEPFKIRISPINWV